MRHTEKNHILHLLVASADIAAVNEAIRIALDDPPGIPDSVKAGSGRQRIRNADSDSAIARAYELDIQGTAAEIDRITTEFASRGVSGLTIVNEFSTHVRAEIDRAAILDQAGLRMKPES